MKGNISSFLSGIALVFFLIFSPSFVHAQLDAGLEIKPGVIEDRVNPGDVYRFTLRVKNLSAVEQLFYVDKQDISSLDEQGQPVFAPEGQATEYELSTWITSSADTIRLQAGEEGAVSFVAHVPMGVAPGSHFGGIFFTTKPPRPEGSGAAIGIRVGSVISLRVSGAITEDARLREFSTGRAVYDHPNVDFKIRLEDLGNVLLRPHGLIEITDMRGEQVASVEVNKTGAPVFPGTDRVYAPVWNYDKFAFGRYQAVLSVVYGEEGRKTLSSTTSFWVLPVKLILTVLGSLLGAMFALYVLVRIYIRKKLREMGVVPGKQGGAEYYEKKYNQSATRMLIIVSSIFLFCIVCFAVLFFMFA